LEEALGTDMDGGHEHRGGVGHKKNTDEYLSSIYYDPLHPGSYSGEKKFWNTIKEDNTYNLSYKDVKNWLR
jgi:hypothetical protein